MRLVLLLIVILLLSPASTAAQDNTCVAVVEEAFSSTAAHCADMGSGEVCFGHAAIESVIDCDLPPDFASPGDTVPLDSVCALRLGAMTPAGQWGVARMQVRPTGSDRDVTYFLMGEIEIQNAASARSEMQVWIQTGTDVYSGPGSHFSIIGTLAAGDVIRANACNCTGNWLRTVLEDGRIGWIPARRVTMLGDAAALPVVQADTPVYASMQAFAFHSGGQPPACAESPEDGILIQVPPNSGEVNLQINSVEVVLDSTIFVQSQAGGSLTVEVLDGVARVAVPDFTAIVPAGARAVVSLGEASLPAGAIRVEPYAREDVASLPTSLLPEPVDQLAPLNDEMPHIVGAETCVAVSEAAGTVCPLHFVNPDGDEITRMNVEFVYAPQGEWIGSAVENPELLGGDSRSGQLPWRVSCSLGSANFIGPVRWSITLTDEMGHNSQPFEASFNCVAG